MYRTAHEVVGEGLRLLIERDQQAESLRRDVRAGLRCRRARRIHRLRQIQMLADRV